MKNLLAGQLKDVPLDIMSELTHGQVIWLILFSSFAVGLVSISSVMPLDEDWKYVIWGNRWRRFMRVFSITATTMTLTWWITHTL